MRPERSPVPSHIRPKPCSDATADPTTGEAREFDHLPDAPLTCIYGGGRVHYDGSTTQKKRERKG